jgi:hypothetical protein
MSVRDQSSFGSLKSCEKDGVEPTRHGVFSSTWLDCIPVRSVIDLELAGQCTGR